MSFPTISEELTHRLAEYSKCSINVSEYIQNVGQVQNHFLSKSYTSMSYISRLVFKMFLPPIGAIWQSYSFKVKPKKKKKKNPLR